MTRRTNRFGTLNVVSGLLMWTALALFAQPAAAEMYLVWTCPSGVVNGSVASCSDPKWERGGNRPLFASSQIVASASTPGSRDSGVWRRWEDVQPGQYVYTCMADQGRLTSAGCGSESYQLKSTVGPVPSAKIGTTYLISPTAAAAYFTSNATSTNQLGLARPKEVVELARALSNDWLKIVDYVRNNIQISWTFGLQKGALGTLLDRQGNAFDQAHLSVELLRQAGYPNVNYEFGTFTVTNAEFTAWTGITTQRAACELLSSGGIPAVVGTSGNAYDCNNIAAAAALPSTITLAHVWVSFVIPSTGKVHYFNPSYKAHTFHAGINLAGKMGLTSGQALTSTSSGIQSGTAGSGVGFISNLNAESLNSTLQSYGTNLLSSIQNEYPSMSVDELVGASEIQWLDPIQIPVLRTLPNHTASATWSAIPDQYRTRLRVEVAKSFQESTSLTGVNRFRFIDQQLFVDEIYGRKLVVNPSHPAQATQTGTAPFSARMLLTDRVSTVATVASYCVAPNNTHKYCTSDKAATRDGTVRLTVNHPYAASGTLGEASATGTYMDRVAEKAVFMFTPFTILHSWGSTGDGLAESWGTRLETAMPPVPYEEFGCDKCSEYYYSTRGDARREQMAASWMVQSSRAAEMHANIARSIYAHHHSVGVSSADSFPFGVDLVPSNDSPLYYIVPDSFDRIDVDSAFSLTSKSSNAAERRAAVAAIAATSEALEGSVAEQVADLPDVSSTATRFEWGNRPVAGEDYVSGSQTPVSGTPAPRRFYRYDSSNSGQAEGLARVEGVALGGHDGQISSIGGQPEISDAEMSTRRAALGEAVKAYSQIGFDVVASEDVFLGPGQRGGAFRTLGTTEGTHSRSQQRGGALVATRYDSGGNPVEIAHILVGHDENSKGGGGGTQSNQQARYDPAEAADVLKARFVDRSSAVGVDLTKGRVTYTAPATISVGNGGFPYELSANLIWRGGNEVTEMFGPIVHTQPLTPWTTNWHNTLNVSSSALEALGATDPRAAAGTIAAFVAQQDVYKAAASTQREVAAVLVGSWLMKKISGNVVSVTVGADTRQFVRNVVGDWFPPGPGSYATLTPTGQRTKYVESCGSPWTPTRGWNYAGMSFKVRNAQGDEQNFGYWANNYYTGPSNNCAKMKGFRLTSWTFPQGMTVNLVYTPQGSGQLDRFTEVNNSLGRRIRFNYSSDGKLIGFDNGLTGTEFMRSVVITNTGSAFGLDSIQEPITTAITRFQTSLVAQEYLLNDVFDADDTTVPSLRYTYDSLNRVKEASDAITLQMGTRNPHQFLIAEGVRGERLDPAGGRYTVLYDKNKRPFRHIDEIGRITRVKHDGRGRVTEYHYPDEDKQVFQYDARNNITSLAHVNKGATDTHTITAEWHTTWNKPAWIQDAKQERTNFEYYASGNGASLLWTATRPADQDGVRPVYNFTYNARGQVLDATDPTGLITRNTYDPGDGDLATSGLPVINAISTYVHDAIGDLTSITDPRQNTTEYLYDRNRRRTLIKNHNGNIGAAVIAAQRTTFNLVGLVTKEEAGTAFSGVDVTAWQTLQDITYTRNGQVFTQTNGAGNTVTKAYDGMDRVFEVDDPVHRKIRFEYDLAGQVLREIRAFGTALQQDYATYTYTPNGKRDSVRDARNNRTEFRYDRFDRLRYVKYPVATVGANQVNENDFDQYDYDNNGNRTLHIRRDGKGIVSFFDNLNREINRNYPEDSSGNLQFKYDLAGRPLWKRVVNTNTGVDYAYDNAKRLTGETSFGRTMTYGYDLAGNRNYVQWPDSNYISYSFDAMNRMTEVRENQTTAGVGVLQTYYWDPLSRRSATTPLSRANSTTTSFAYDAASRLSGLGQNFAGTASDFTLGFGYTAASQLQTRTTTNDAIGWWVAPNAVHAYQVNGLNRYTTLNNVSFTYNNNGSLTSDGTRTFTYDTENRLTSATGGSAAVTLSYDPVGRLYRTVSGSDTTIFLYDGDRLVAEYTGAGAVKRRYAHGHGVDEPIVWYEGAGLTDKRWLHSDERGSIVAFSNTSGVATAHQYGPYGEPSEWTGSRFRYTGQIMLPEAQLYHYKARVYDPKLGRFLQTDPIGYEDDVNLYSYVGSDPLNEVDPTGMCTGSRIENGNGTCAATGGFTNDTAGAAQGAAIRMAQARPPRGGSGGASRPGAGQRATPPNASNSQRYIPQGSLQENEHFPNAHVLRKHVGRTITQLQNRFRKEPNIRASSSFRTEAEAQAFISDALAQRPIERIAVGSGTFQRSFRVEMGQPTGTSVLPNGTVQIPTGVRVVIRHDRTSDTGYYIYTAYPD